MFKSVYFWLFLQLLAITFSWSIANSIRGDSTVGNVVQQEYLTAIKDDRVDAVESLITSNRDLLSWRNGSGWSPLHFAAYHGAEKVVEYLLEKGVNLTGVNFQRETPLHLACLQGHSSIISRIVNHVKAGVLEEKELADAKKMASQALERLDDIKVLASGKDSALQQTSLLRQAADAIERIFKRASSQQSLISPLLEAQQIDGRTPIFYAISGRYISVVAELMDAGANLWHYDKFGMLPIHYAIANRNTEQVNSFITRNFDFVEAATLGSGKTISHLAAEYNIVDLATDNFDAEAKDSIGQTPSCWAARNGSLEFSMAMMSETTRLNGNHCSFGANHTGSALHVAVYYRHRQYVDWLLARTELSENPLDSSKGTPLHAMALEETKDPDTDKAIIENLVRKLSGIVEFRDATGKTPFLLAVESGSQIFAKLLRNHHGADVNAADSQGYTALHLMTGDIGFFDYLLSTVKNRTIETRTRSGLTVLLAATERKQPIAFLRHLISNELAKTDVTDELRQNVVHVAIRVGYDEAVDEFKRKGLDFLAKDYVGRTSLHLAVTLGKTGIAVKIINDFKEQLLLIEPVGDGSLNTPLHLAAQKGNVEVMRTLLANSNVKLDSLNTNRQTALHIAVAYQHPEAVDLLLPRDNSYSTLTLQDDLGQTAFHLVAASCNEDAIRIAKALFGLAGNSSAVDTVDSYDQTPIEIAVRRNCLEMFQLFMTSNNSTSSDHHRCLRENKNGLTSLQLASSLGYDRLVDLAVRRGLCPSSGQKSAPVNIRRSCGSLPFIENGEISCGSNTLGSVRYVLCQEGYGLTGNGTLTCNRDGKWLVNVWCRKVKFSEKILSAAEQGDFRKIKVLVERAEADINSRDEVSGYTALILAARLGNLQLVRQLLDYGANPNYLTIFSGSFISGRINGPLYWAVRNNDTAMVRMLIERGAHVNRGNYYGWTALKRAVRYQQTAMVRLLLQHGAITSGRTNSFTVLQLAVYGNHSKALNMLLQEGANVNEKDNAIMKYDAHLGFFGSSMRLVGSTALMTAANVSNIEAVRTLLDYGANVDDQDEEGNTALMYAAKTGRLAICELLIAKNANLNVVNKHNKSALSIAKDQGFDSVVQLLVKNGAVDK